MKRQLSILLIVFSLPLLWAVNAFLSIGDAEPGFDKAVLANPVVVDGEILSRQDMQKGRVAITYQYKVDGRGYQGTKICQGTPNRVQVTYNKISPDQHFFGTPKEHAAESWVLFWQRFLINAVLIGAVLAMALPGLL